LRRLDYVNLALALAALALGLYAVVRPPAPSTPPSATPARDPAQLREEVVRLRQAVAALDARTSLGSTEGAAALAQRLERLEAALPRPVSATGVAAPPAPSAPQEAGRPRYQRLTASSPAITVTQLSDRNFAVTNSDPALTDKPFTVQAIRPDGTTDTYTIIAPEPGPTPSTR